MFILLRTLLLVPSPRILHPPSEEHHLVHGFSHCCTPITSKCMSPQPRPLSSAFPISFSESVHGIIHWNVYGNLGSTYPLEGEYLFFTSFVFFQWGVILISITLLVSPHLPPLRKGDPPWLVSYSQRACAPDCSWSAGRLVANAWHLS